MALVIKTIKVGYLQENCYILSINSDTLIIDPGDEGDKIVTYLKDNHLNLLAVLITHHHPDHIGAIEDVCHYKDVPVYDYSNLKKKEITIGPFIFDVIKTPGHTNDSITYYFKEDSSMFVGDFIFDHSIGRTDIGGSDTDMKQSLNMIKKYPDDTIIYSGHGDRTILGIEKRENIYLN